MIKKTILIAALSLVMSCSVHTKGQDGTPGKPGINGQNGENGKDGEDGKSIIGINLNKKETHKEITEGILVGAAKMIDLQQAPFNEWFNNGYNEYQANDTIIKEIKKYSKDYHITIFMGTWCEDSQNQVPKFYKILKQLDFPLKKVTLITMKRDKTTPEAFEKGLNITNVPTFIFYKNKIETNRIVESPVESLEQDFLNIVSGKTYKHIYAD